MPDYAPPPPSEKDPLEALSRFQEALDCPPPFPLDGDPYLALAAELLEGQTHIQILGNPGTGKTQLLEYLGEKIRSNGELCLLVSPERNSTRAAFFPAVASLIHSALTQLHAYLQRSETGLAAREIVLQNLRQDIERIERFHWPIEPKPELVSGILCGMKATFAAVNEICERNIYLQFDNLDHQGDGLPADVIPPLLRFFATCGIRFHWTETRTDLLNRTAGIAELNGTGDRLKVCLNQPIEAIEATQVQIEPILQHYCATAGIESWQELLSFDARTRLHFASGGRRTHLLGLLRAATLNAVTRLMKDLDDPRGSKVRVEDINRAAFLSGQWKIDHLSDLCKSTADLAASMALFHRIRAACTEQAAFNVCLLPMSVGEQTRAALIKAGLIHPFNFFTVGSGQNTACGRVHLQAYLLDYSQYTGEYRGMTTQIFQRCPDSENRKRQIIHSAAPVID